MKIKQKLVKIFFGVFLGCSLVFSQVGTAFAAYDYSVVRPWVYIFNLALSSCGVYAGQNSGLWLDAYKGYLTSIGDASMLSQLEGYEDLSWGDTASGAVSLVKSVKHWLSQSPDYAKGSILYDLPSGFSGSSSFIADHDDYIISSTPFSECGEYTGTKKYAFSVAYMTSEGDVVYRNYYPIDTMEKYGLETVGCILTDSMKNQVGWSDRVSVELIRGGSSAGRTAPVTADVQECRISPDGTSSVSSVTSSKFYIDYNSLLSGILPFKVFADKALAANYLGYGYDSGLIGSGFASVYEYMSDQYVSSVTVAVQDDAIQLPNNPNEMLSGIEGAMGNPDSLASALSSAGLQVAFSEEEFTEPTEPEPTEPAPTEPAPTEPEPTEPAPTEPEPTEPEPTEPESTEPEPTEPLPSEPGSTNPDAPALVADGIVAGVEEVTGGMKDGLVGVLPVSLPVFGSLFVVLRLIGVWRKLTGGL